MVKRFKIYFIFFFLLLPVIVKAQATQFIVESFQLDLNDLEANRNPVFDANDKKCALIKVRTDLSDITFSSNNGVVEEKKVLTEYWVYVSYDEKRLQLYKEGFLPLHYDIPVSLEESKVYTFYITTSKRFSIVIQTEPKEAIITLDNILTIGPNIANITPGKHEIKIEKDGYMSIKDTINISDGNIFFSYVMVKQEPVIVTITSDPPGSALIIDSDFKGLTPRQLFLYPGKYQVQLSKEFYQSVKTDIQVNSKAANLFNYKLQSNISYVGIYTYPTDAQIFLDGNRIFDKQKIEGGDHLIEVKKDLYYNEKKMVHIRGGIDTSVVIYMRAKTGNLQFTVNPIDANAELYKGELLAKSWTGAQRIENLNIGDYTLKVNAKKCKKVEKQIKIKENVTEDIYIDLTTIQKTKEIKSKDEDLSYKSKSKMAAFGLSILCPGLGQYYTGHIGRGIFYTLTGLGAAAATVYFNSEFNKMNNTYNQSYISYQNAVTLNDISESWNNMQNNRKDLEVLNKNTIISLGSFTAIYSISLIDALISGSKKKKVIIGFNKNKNYLKIQPTSLYGGMGLEIKYRF